MNPGPVAIPKMIVPPKNTGNQPQGEQSEALKRYLARREALEMISIDLVLERLGADAGQDGDRSKWKIPAVGNIITKGQSWKNVNTNVHKGFGGVSLVRHAKDFARERDAMDWLEQQFGAADKIAPEAKAAATGPREKPQFFDPPPVMDHLWERVREYLTGSQKGQRGVPPALADRIHEMGTLYASQAYSNVRKQYYGEPRAVFMGPASAEVREIVPDGFKGCTEGSNPDISCFHVPHVEDAEEEVFSIQEAAVDSLSYAALFPGRYSVSTNGVGRFPLQYRLALEALDSQYAVRLAFDADLAGDVGAQHVFNGLFARNMLSRRLGVSPETVDQWLLTGVVDVTPLHTPHHLFFNNGWQPALPVHERVVETDADGKVREVWRPTGNNAPPTVRMNVTRTGLHERLEKKCYDVPVSERVYEYITEVLNLRRERPEMGKDWNDELRRLGSSYMRTYEREARKNFVDGVPALPPHLEKLRTSKAKVLPAPAPAPTPVVAAAEPAQVHAPAPAVPVRPSFQR